MKLKLFIIITLITLIGGLLRFYEITTNPLSLNTDEVTFAYNAYSILKTGRDEYGEFMPITFRSIGDYKNPVPTYLMVPSIALFGLNEFGVRLPFALIGTLAIPLFYLVAIQLTKKRSVGLAVAVITAISPWHIFYSRYGSDPQMALVIATAGIYFFLKMVESKKIAHALLSSFFLIASMYTYYVERAFIPLITLLMLLIYFRKYLGEIISNMFNLKITRVLRDIKQNDLLKLLIIFLVFSAVLTIPLIYRSFFGPDLARGNMVFIVKDADFQRYAYPSNDNPLTQGVALGFFIAKRYLNYLQSDYLFFSGLNLTEHGSLGLGILHLFELPWLVIGIFVLLASRNKNKGFIFGWIMLSYLPAAFTNNEHNPSRTIIAMPAVFIIIALGFLKSIEIVSSIKAKLIRLFIYSAYSTFIIISLIHAFLVYAVHLPLDRGEYSMEGNKEAVLYAIENKDLYDEIVLDPFRGTLAPTTYGLPHAYVLFFSAYDPARYQTGQKEFDGVFGFDKYRIRKIYWPDDRYKTRTLFIGSPWSLPAKDLKEGEVLKRIYLRNGQEALIIANPKP